MGARWAGAFSSGVGGLLNYTPPRVFDSPTPNYTNSNRPRTRGVVLHATHGNGADQMAEFWGTLSWFANRDSEVSAHAVIAPDGQIARVAPWGKIAWHAKSYNQEWLGVEFAKRRPDRYDDLVTEQQYLSGAWLIRYWADMYDFDKYSLLEHREIQRDKIDIGPGFDIERLKGLL